MRLHSVVDLMTNSSSTVYNSTYNRKLYFDDFDYFKEQDYMDEEELVDIEEPKGRNEKSYIIKET